jgi:hypothetical protein
LLLKSQEEKPLSSHLSCDILTVILKWYFRRVHISSVTLEHLNGAYKVEEGDGDIRDPYLKQHLVKTYFVINPKVSIIVMSL